MSAGGWFTDKDGRVRHSRTGAADMREHREKKRRQAFDRNAQTPEWRRSAKAKRKEMSDALARLRRDAVDVGRSGARAKRRRPHRTGQGTQATPHNATGSGARSR